MNAGSLRPLGVGEMLDAAIRIYVRRFTPMTIAVAVSSGLLLLLSAFVQVSSQPPTDDLFVLPDEAGGEVLFEGRELAIFAAGLITATMVTFVATQIASGATLRIASGAYFGDSPDWKAGVRWALSRLPSLLWIGLLTLLGFMAPICLVAATVAIHPAITVLGALALLPFVVWFYVAIAVAIPVFLVEDLRGIAALRRSISLVRGRFWPTLLLLVVVTLLTTVVGGLLGGAISLIGAFSGSAAVSVIMTALGSLVANVLVVPFTVAASLVLYIDLRVRKEGYDLELLAAGLGAPTPAAGFGAVNLPGVGPAPGAGWQPPPWQPPGWSPDPSTVPAPGWGQTTPWGPPPAPDTGAPPAWAPTPGGTNPGATQIPGAAQIPWAAPMPGAARPESDSPPASVAPPPAVFESRRRPPSTPLPPAIAGQSPQLAAPPPPLPTNPAMQPPPPPPVAEIAAPDGEGVPPAS